MQLFEAEQASSVVLDCLSQSLIHHIVYVVRQDHLEAGPTKEAFL
jgi:hypothetical protein